jgi:asparagine synthase (glutamine-hydrolysing)
VCGLAGYVGTRELEVAAIERTLRLMHHRGPNHAGWRAFKTASARNAYLLSTRLNIIDLNARADQPFQVASKTMSYNGELYNYLEVRAELERAGRRFSTESDTEVLLTAIDEWGADGLDRCEGMWALAVFDAADGALTLSRDRFGEKPLYVLRDETGLYFGSEVKLLVELSGRRPAANLDQLYRYLVHGYKSLYKAGATFFEGVQEVVPGGLLRIDMNGEERASSYWRPRIGPEVDMSYEEAVAATRERLLRAVEIRLRADVPLAFCMSGGVDSVALISAAKKVFGYDVHGFTIENTDERYEEQEMVDLAVAELGIRHTSIPVDTTGFLSKLRALVRHHDAPVATITYYAHWLLMASVGVHGYRVSVSGTAADELFTGYYDHHLAYLAAVAGEPALHAASVAGWQEHVRPLVRNPLLQDPDLFIREPGFRGHIYFDAEGFADYLQREWSEPFAERDFGDGVLRGRMLNELFVETVPVILHEDDLNAMYFSIENRSPYLDRSLFEFTTTVPTRHLVRGGRAKSLLRDAMRGIAPDAILDNPRKVGFNAPIFSFLDVRDPVVRAELLADSPVWEHVRREKIVELLDRDWLPNSESKFLFYFLNAKFFLEELAA